MLQLKSPKTYSLRTKATLIVVAVVVVSLALATAINISQTNQLIESEQKRSAEAIVQGLAQAAELPMIVQDKQELDRIIGGFLWNDQVQFLVIYDNEKNIVASRTLDKEAFESFVKTGRNEGSLIVSHPIVFQTEINFSVWSSSLSVDNSIEEKEVGRVLVALSLGAVRRDQIHQAFVSMAAALLAAAVGIFLIFKGIGEWTKRVDGLVGAADAMKSGDFSCEIPSGGRDEVGKLAAAFEAMRKAVQQRDTEYRELNNSLHDLVLERTEKLERAMVEAQTANEAKSSFLANMSHEIRTPMNAIIGMVGLSLNKKLSPKLREYLLTVRSSAESLLAIINDILDFSKIEAGKITFEKVDFQLPQLFDKLVNLFSDQATSKNIEFVVGIEPGIPLALRGDPLRMEQVFINLLGNAIKFTDKGVIFVHATLDSETATGVRILFSVSDTGVGIGEEQYESLFEPFTQADGSMTREYGGTGLGLSICRRLVNLHGGDIWVRSKPGEGTTVFFTAEFERQPVAHEIQYVVPAKIRGSRVLIIDDNEMARCVTSKMLEAFHFHVDVVSSCVAAKDRIGESIFRYDIILVDRQMPEVNGLECVQSLRSLDGVEETPIIMLTASGGDREIMEAREVGITYFLSKPVRQSLLFDTIMDIFDYPEAMHAALDGREKVGEPVSFEHLAGVRILLAEDNRINQNVARELLESVGATVEIANNGREAVEVLKQHSREFDAVLMDVQMPVMDGLQATEVIRTMPDLMNLPVVAVTAHAMQGDREKCMKAGMNDYVAKPITPERLFAVLSRLIVPEKKEAGYSGQLKIRRVSLGENHIPESLPGIHVKSGVTRMAGNLRAYVRMVSDLVQFGEDVVQSLPHIVENGMEDAIKEVHTLKGTAANLSALRLQKVSLKLEQSLKASCGGNKQNTDSTEMIAATFEEDIEQIRGCLVELTEAVTELKTFCMETAKKISIKPLSPSDCEEMLDILGQLRIMIHEYDPMSEEFWVEKKIKFQGIGVNCEMNRMEEYLRNYNFERAAEYISLLEQTVAEQGVKM